MGLNISLHIFGDISNNIWLPQSSETLCRLHPYCTNIQSLSGNNREQYSSDATPLMSHNPDLGIISPTSPELHPFEWIYSRGVTTNFSVSPQNLFTEFPNLHHQAIPMEV